jgi:hypothetical protein
MDSMNAIVSSITEFAASSASVTSAGWTSLVCILTLNLFWLVVSHANIMLSILTVPHTNPQRSASEGHQNEVKLSALFHDLPNAIHWIIIVRNNNDTGTDTLESLLMVTIVSGNINEAATTSLTGAANVMPDIRKNLRHAARICVIDCTVNILPQLEPDANSEFSVCDFTDI